MIDSFRRILHLFRNRFESFDAHSRSKTRQHGRKLAIFIFGTKRSKCRAQTIIVAAFTLFYSFFCRQITKECLHTPLQESSKTADDGASAPREWCGCSGCMVHSGRRHGAHGRRAFPLFGNTFALAHGFTLDLDGVGVVDDPVTDGVGQGGVVQVLVPLAGVVLGAEDGGGHLAPGLY